MALMPPHYPYEYVKTLDKYACDECIRLGVPEQQCHHTTQSYTLYFFLSLIHISEPTRPY